MAGIAGCRRRDMRSRFAHGTCAVVASLASTRSSQGMTVTGRQPARGLVAGIT
jgi:hypothetical protein